MDCEHHKVFLDEVCAGEREEQSVVLQGRAAEVGVAAESEAGVAEYKGVRDQSN